MDAVHRGRLVTVGVLGGGGTFRLTLAYWEGAARRSAFVELCAAVRTGARFATVSEAKKAAEEDLRKAGAVPCLRWRDKWFELGKACREVVCALCGMFMARRQAALRTGGRTAVGFFFS